jgi:hypothetical protein
MTLRTLAILTLALITSSCSLLGTRDIEVISKPVEIEIIQPILPRPLDLTAPNWFVVSETKIANNCKKIMVDGKEKRPKSCELEDRENPEWPVGYTYLDRFIDEMKKQNSGDVVFVATTVGDYKVMIQNNQELRRYIQQMGEVVVYYRNVTIKDQPALGAEVKKK